jgi:hypothetical protein
MKGFVKINWFLLFQVLPTASHIPSPEKSLLGEEVPTFEFNLSPTSLEEQLGSYLEEPLSFPSDHNAKCLDVTTFQIPPQEEEQQTDLDSKRENFSDEHPNCEKHHASRWKGYPSSSAYKSQVSPPACKRKQAQMKDISRKSEKVSTQAKDSSNIFQSNLRRDQSLMKVNKGLEKGPDAKAQASCGNRQEGSDKILSISLNSPSGEHIDETPHEKIAHKDDKIVSLRLNHSEEHRVSFDVRKTKKKQNRENRLDKKKVFREEVERIMKKVKNHLRLNEFLDKMNDKLTGNLDEWAKAAKSPETRPDITVKSIQHYVKYVTGVSTFLILQQISNQMGLQGKLTNDTEKVNHVLKFMTQFWDSSLKREIKPTFRCSWIPRIADYLNPEIKIMMKKGSYVGQALCYVTSREILQYWENVNRNRQFYSVVNNNMIGSERDLQPIILGF